MNEFEQKDYEQSRSLADAIKTNADNIMGIFESIDNTMNTLYGEAWQSTGANSTHERYNKLRENYNVFYQDVINMHNHIYKITASNEATDKNVSGDISSI